MKESAKIGIRMSNVYDEWLSMNADVAVHVCYSGCCEVPIDFLPALASWRIVEQLMCLIITLLFSVCLSVSPSLSLRVAPSAQSLIHIA